jgi:hypothetical protein
MKFQAEFDSKKGLTVNLQITQKILKALITASVGIASLPWLAHLAQVIGLM